MRKFLTSKRRSRKSFDKYHVCDDHDDDNDDDVDDDNEDDDHDHDDDNDDIDDDDDNDDKREWSGRGMIHGHLFCAVAKSPNRRLNAKSG